MPAGRKASLGWGWGVCPWPLFWASILPCAAGHLSQCSGVLSRSLESPVAPKGSAQFWGSLPLLQSMLAPPWSPIPSLSRSQVPSAPVSGAFAKSPATGFVVLPGLCGPPQGLSLPSNSSEPLSGLPFTLPPSTNPSATLPAPTLFLLGSPSFLGAPALCCVDPEASPARSLPARLSPQVQCPALGRPGSAARGPLRAPAPTP